MKPLTVRPELSFPMGQLLIHIVSLNRGQLLSSIPAHSHGKNCYELHYIPKGTGSVVLGGVLRACPAGSLWMAGPLAEHAQLPDASDPMWEYCVYLTARSIPSSQPADPLLSCFAGASSCLKEDCFGAGALFDALFFELEHKPPGWLFQAEALLRQIILFTARSFFSRPALNRRADGDAPAPMLEGQSLLIEQYFLNEYASLSLDALSSLLGVSPRQAQRILLLLYGKNFQQKKTEARMEKAALLLIQTSNKMELISEQLGYASAGHFSAAFRKYYGITPREYRSRADFT